MTPRAKKEFRVLLLPWSVAILAAFSLPIVATLVVRMHRQYVGWFLLKWVEPLVCVSASSLHAWLWRPCHLALSITIGRLD